jgi:hypothetical protein
MHITYTIEQKLIDEFIKLGFSPEIFTQNLSKGMQYFTHIWPHTVQQVSVGSSSRLQFLLPTPAQSASWNHAWGWSSGRKLYINPYPKTSSGNISLWSLSGIQHIAHHEAGHALIYSSHFKLPSYYGSSRFSHVLSIIDGGLNYYGSYSPYEHWYRRSWGIKKEKAWHPFVHEWLKMSNNERQNTRSLLLNIVAPYYQLGQNKNNRLHSLIGVTDIDNQLRSLPYLSKPTIPQSMPFTENTIQTQSVILPFRPMCGICSKISKWDRFWSLFRGKMLS